MIAVGAKFLMGPGGHLIDRGRAMLLDARIDALEDPDATLFRAARGYTADSVTTTSPFLRSLPTLALAAINGARSARLKASIVVGTLANSTARGRPT